MYNKTNKLTVHPYPKHLKNNHDEDINKLDFIPLNFLKHKLFIKITMLYMLTM